MKTLITGGTGYIGERLVAQLISRGKEVVVFGLPGILESDAHKKGVVVCAGDVRDAAAVRRAMSGCSRVYHLAAYARNWARNANLFFEVNVRGTQTVLQVALERGVERVLHVSSNVVLGPSNGVCVGEDAPRVSDFLTPYERSKLASDEVARTFALRGLDVVLVCPSRVFGPGLAGESNSVTKLIQLYLAGRWRFIPGDGTSVGNYVYVEDLVRGMILAMENGRRGERYILGGSNLSFDELFDHIRRVSGKRYSLAHLPAWIALAYSYAENARARWLGGHPTVTPGWVRTFLGNWANSIEKAQTELGYRCTPFDIALKNTIDWIQCQAGSRS